MVKPEVGAFMNNETYTLFMKNEVIPFMDQAIMNLEDAIRENKQELEHRFTTQFRMFCNEIIKWQEEEQITIGYLTFHMLKTNLIARKLTYQVIAYTPDWYLGKEKYLGEYDVSFFYDPYIKVWDELDKNFRKYVGKISEADVEHLMLQLANEFHKYLTAFLRMAVRKVISIEEYQKIQKADEFHILAGEYMDSQEELYIDRKEQNVLAVKKKIMKNKRSFHCEDFKGLEFSNLNLDKYDLAYADFTNANLKSSSLRVAELQGVNFKNTNLKGTDFTGSNLCAVDFNGADLTNAVLDCTVSIYGMATFMDTISARLYESKFTHAVLENASFRNAILIGVDFVGAVFKNTDFTGANLYKCKFEKHQLEQLALDREQLEQIEIMV